MNNLVFPQDRRASQVKCGYVMNDGLKRPQKRVCGLELFHLFKVERYSKGFIKVVPLISRFLFLIEHTTFKV